MFHLSRVLARARTLFREEPAVVCGEATFTYGELGIRVAAISSALRQSGLSPGDRVAVLDRNSFRFLELNFAAADAALVLLPLNIRLAATEMTAILRQTACRVLFTSSTFSGVAAEIRAAIPSLRLVRWNADEGVDADNEYEELIRLGRETAAVTASSGADGAHSADDIAQIFFTSGTTGEPKGVCLTSANFVASAYDSIAMLDMSRRDVWLHAAPMFHLADAFAIWTVTLVGGRHVIAPFDAAGFPAIVAREHVTKTSLPPVLIDQIARHGSGTSPDLRTLDRITYGGSPMLDAVHRRAAAFFPCPLLQCYGITETCGMVCQQMPGDYRLDGSEAGARRRASVGRPTPAIDLRVIDDEGRECGSGEVGELAISGPRLMAGYWNQPTATTAVVRNGWYFTGDLGFRDDDWHVFIVDRKKDMIISGGENVYSVEVENALATHPAVVEAAVFGIPSERWGEEVKAIVVLHAGATADSSELIEHCRRRIGGYKLPKTIDIALEPLPKTGPGKIAKALLRAPYWK